VHFWSQQQKDADTKRELDELRREIARNADIGKRSGEEFLLVFPFRWRTAGLSQGRKLKRTLRMPA
jgi:hypothetical protein